MSVRSRIRSGLLLSLCLALAACGGTAPAASTPPAPSAGAPTAVPTPPAMEDPITAVYAFLERGPSADEQLVVAPPQGFYTRVALTSTLGDGTWFFLQQSSVGSWFVLTTAGMTAQPDLTAARAQGVPEALLQDLDGGAPPSDTGGGTELPTDPDASIWTRPLSQQSPALTGDDVRILQQRLAELGYRAVGTPDGVFGAQTSRAVLAFQARNGVTVDGIVGEATWSLLWSTAAVSADSLAVVDGTVEVAFDAAHPAPPAARIELLPVGGGGAIVATMPEQAAGLPFSVAAPPGLYTISARSLRVNDLSFYGL